MSDKSRQSLLYEAAFVVAALTFAIYLVAAVYIRGYLHFFNADAAWFSPSAFQLLVFSTVPVGETIVFLIVWTAVAILSAISWHLPEDEKLFQFRRRSWKEVWTEFRKTWNAQYIARLIALLFLFMFYIGGVTQAHIRLSVGLQFSMQSEWQQGLESVVSYAYPVIIISPIAIGAFWGMADSLSMRKFRSDLAIIQDYLEADGGGTSTEEQRVNADEASKRISSIKKITPYLPVFVLILSLALIVFVAFCSYLVGIVDAESDYEQFLGHYLESTAADDEGKSIWVVFADADTALTFEISKDGGGFYITRSGLHPRIRLKWSQSVNDEITSKRIIALSGFVVDYANEKKLLPKSLAEVIAAADISPDLLVDAWNNSFEYRLIDFGAHKCELRSAGQDAAFDTDDDVVVPIGPKTAGELGMTDSPKNRNAAKSRPR